MCFKYRFYPIRTVDTNRRLPNCARNREYWKSRQCWHTAIRCGLLPSITIAVKVCSLYLGSVGLKGVGGCKTIIPHEPATNYTLSLSPSYSNIKMNDSVVYFNVLLSILVSNRWNIQQSCQRKFVMKTKLFTPLIRLV